MCLLSFSGAHTLQVRADGTLPTTGPISDEIIDLGTPQNEFYELTSVLLKKEKNYGDVLSFIFMREGLIFFKKKKRKKKINSFFISEIIHLSFLVSLTRTPQYVLPRVRLSPFFMNIQTVCLGLTIQFLKKCLN